MEPGQRHLVVGAVVLNGKKEILCTRRSLKKDKYPGHWECTQGSAIAGEDSLTAIIREVREETGIEFASKQLTLIYQEVQESWFADIYSGFSVLSAEQLTFQEGETEAAAWVEFQEWDARVRAGEILLPIRDTAAFIEKVRRFSGIEDET